MNLKLLEVITPNILTSMGFKKEEDDTGDPRGTDWNIRTINFHLMVDAWANVKLCRLNPDTDFISIQVDDLSELRQVVDWIDENK